jgi:hypothetical protein
MNKAENEIGSSISIRVGKKEKDKGKERQRARTESSFIKMPLANTLDSTI